MTERTRKPNKSWAITIVCIRSCFFLLLCLLSFGMATSGWVARHEEDVRKQLIIIIISVKDKLWLWTECGANGTRGWVVDTHKPPLQAIAEWSNTREEDLIEMWTVIYDMNHSKQHFLNIEFEDGAREILLSTRLFHYAMPIILCSCHVYLLIAYGMNIPYADCSKAHFFALAHIDWSTLWRSISKMCVLFSDFTSNNLQCCPSACQLWQYFKIINHEIYLQLCTPHAACLLCFFVIPPLSNTRILIAYQNYHMLSPSNRCQSTQNWNDFEALVINKSIGSVYSISNMKISSFQAPIKTTTNCLCSPNQLQNISFCSKNTNSQPNDFDPTVETNKIWIAEKSYKNLNIKSWKKKIICLFFSSFVYLEYYLNGHSLNKHRTSFKIRANKHASPTSNYDDFSSIVNEPKRTTTKNVKIKDPCQRNNGICSWRSNNLKQSFGCDLFWLNILSSFLIFFFFSFSCSFKRIDIWKHIFSFFHSIILLIARRKRATPQS